MDVDGCGYFRLFWCWTFIVNYIKKRYFYKKVRFVCNFLRRAYELIRLLHKKVFEGVYTVMLFLCL